MSFVGIGLNKKHNPFSWKCEFFSRQHKIPFVNKFFNDKFACLFRTEDFRLDPVILFLAHGEV